MLLCEHCQKVDNKILCLISALLLHKKKSENLKVKEISFVRVFNFRDSRGQQYPAVLALRK